jgi:hypothetical protein
MKPKGQSDTVAARFAAKLFTVCGASFLFGSLAAHE